MVVVEEELYFNASCIMSPPRGLEYFFSSGSIVGLESPPHQLH